MYPSKDWATMRQVNDMKFCLKRIVSKNMSNICRLRSPCAGSRRRAERLQP